MKKSSEGSIRRNSSSLNSSPDLEPDKDNLGENIFLENLFFNAYNSFACHVAIIDQNGTIITVNQAWREMLNDGNLGDQAVEGENYLEICEASEGIHSVGGRSFADGLRSVLDGRVDQFVMEYPLSDEDYSQWLLGRINGFENNGKRYAFVLYENISKYQ
jgi:hypothetical protein